MDLDPSQERLAKLLPKLEREVYQIQRPRQLANRGVFLRIGEPIDLGRFVSDYLKDAQSVRDGVAEQLRDQIQALINTMTAVTPGSSKVQSDQVCGRHFRTQGGMLREQASLGSTKASKTGTFGTIPVPRFMTDHDEQR